jgi:rhodanese-related sulfurtransferase
MIVDLRSPLSFKAKHIKNSINIPSSALENLLEWGEPFSKSTSLVLVCNQGEESKKFAALLRQKGFAASNLQGGFSAWRSVGKELYSNIN